MRLVIILLVLAIVFVPAAAQDEELIPWTCPDEILALENKTLNVFNWTTYIAEDTISNFQDLCGVRVSYDTFESGEALVSRLRSGNPGYDIVVPPGSDVARLVAEDLLVPLDHDLIPNLANLSPELLDPPFDPGNEYSLPYQWGTIGIGYNRAKLGYEITSWMQMFDYPERTVAWLEDRRPMLGIALLLNGFDPNSEDPTEIDIAKEFLIEKGSQNVAYIAGDDGQELLVRGEADIVVEYSGDIFQIMDECECDDYAYIIPEEGANVWIDNLAIPVGAQNIPLAHAFIDYVLDPQVGADISNYTAYASPNQTAIEAGLIDEAYLNDPAIYPDEELMSRLFFVESNLDSEQLYNDAWDEIKIRIGG